MPSCRHLLVSFSLLILPALVHGQWHGDERLARNPLAAGATVMGIAGYTRWPEAPLPLRMCVIGDGDLAESVRLHANRVQSETPLTLRELDPAGPDIADCDLVYFGNMPAETVEALLRQLAGKPVLTLGEGAEFCSDGGMFCLDVVDGEIRFSANLDAISRSTLRVNPQVLRISRQLRGQGV